MSQRTERVDELLRQEIGALLAKEIADPRIGFATITDVETSPDLRHAKVWVSVIGGKADRDETLRALQQSMGYVRHELGRRLRIRRIPELHVRLDDSAERGTRVLHLLNELEAGTDPQAIEPFTDSLPTPVRRLPHEGDTDDPAEAGRRGPGRAEAAAAAPGRAPSARSGTGRRRAIGPRARPAPARPVPQVRPRQARIRQVRLAPRMTEAVDLAALAAAAVPDEVVARLRRAREVLAVGHENPDADTLGATLALCRLVEAHRRAGDGGVLRRAAADLRVHARRRAGPAGSGSRRSPTTCWCCRTARRLSASARSPSRHPELFRDLPRVIIDHHASNDARGDGGLGRPDRRRDVRDDGAARGPARGAARRR